MTPTSFPQRTVRSFMRRTGRMSAGRKQALEIHSGRYSIDLAATPLNFSDIFQRSAPLVLEIGFGMGQSLLEQAQRNPQYDYVGIEVHQAGIAALLAGIEANQLSNIRLICADAVDVLTRHVPDNSLAIVQIFFPDPWPKRRHHKRRLIQSPFIELLQCKLQAGGRLCLATDWEDYAKQMLNVLSASKGLQNSAGEGCFAPRPAERPLTKFESRGQSLGHGVWDLIFIAGEGQGEGV